MLKKSSLLLFAQTMAGIYSNYEQAQFQPNKFAHINIYFRPLSWSILKGPWFYSEQSYDYDPWSPYRQGIHKLIKIENTFIVENYALNVPQRVAGSGFNQELLNNIQRKDFIQRSGCAMHFKETSPGHYLGQVETGRKCLIKTSEAITYLVSKVEFDNNNWTSLDEGIDISSNKKVWGSEHGPLKFKKIKSLSNLMVGQWSELH